MNTILLQLLLKTRTNLNILPFDNLPTTNWWHKTYFRPTAYLLNQMEITS